MWRIIFDRKQLLAIEAWLALPVLVALTIHMCVGNYCRRGHAQLERREAWASLLPNMKTQAAAARSELAALSLSPEQYASKMEALSTEFNALARQVRFTITSLAVTKGEAEPGLGAFHVALSGSGDLAAIARFLYALQMNECLMNVETARLAPQVGPAAGQLGVNILFVFSALPREQKK